MSNNLSCIFSKENTTPNSQIPTLLASSSISVHIDLHFEVDLRLVRNYAYNFVNKDKAHPN